MMRFQNAFIDEAIGVTFRAVLDSTAARTDTAEKTTNLDGTRAKTASLALGDHVVSLHRRKVDEGEFGKQDLALGEFLCSKQACPIRYWRKTILAVKRPRQG